MYFRQHLYSTAWPIYDFCSDTVAQCRERSLALVMGFNRKCSVTSETRAGRRAGGGVGEPSTKGAAAAAGC